MQFSFFHSYFDFVGLIRQKINNFLVSRAIGQYSEYAWGANEINKKVVVIWQSRITFKVVSK